MIANFSAFVLDIQVCHNSVQIDLVNVSVLFGNLTWWKFTGRYFKEFKPFVISLFQKVDSVFHLEIFMLLCCFFYYYIFMGYGCICPRIVWEKRFSKTYQ